MRQSITVEGLKDIYKHLDGLPAKMKGAVLRRVNRKAINIYKNLLKGKIQSRGYSNKIKPEHVIVKNDRYNYSGVIAGLSSEAFVARFIEEGTKERYAIKRKGVRLRNKAYRGRVEANPFVQPAIEEAEKPILKLLEKDYIELISKSLKTQNRLLRRRLNR